MSPCESSGEPGVLEHPAEAFAYYRNQGTPRVVCEEKHMGSRAVVIVCKDEQAARERFGVREGETGIVTTRTGRRFFNDQMLEAQFLDRVRPALAAAGVWTTLATTWVCLDCELLPWSAKAQELLKTQYAAVGAAGLAALPRAVASLTQAAERMSGEERSKSSGRPHTRWRRRPCQDPSSVKALSGASLAPIREPSLPEVIRKPHFTARIWCAGPGHYLDHCGTWRSSSRLILGLLVLCHSMILG